MIEFEEISLFIMMSLETECGILSIEFRKNVQPMRNKSDRSPSEGGAKNMSCFIPRTILIQVCINIVGGCLRSRVQRFPA